jgi:thymidine phosphorylase
MRLGAGRTAKHDTIDHAVGVVCLRKRGDRVEAGDVLAEIHARDESASEAVVDEVRGAYELVDEAPATRSVVLETLS